VEFLGTYGVLTTFNAAEFSLYWHDDKLDINSRVSYVQSNEDDLHKT